MYALVLFPSLSPPCIVSEIQMTLDSKPIFMMFNLGSQAMTNMAHLTLLKCHAIKQQILETSTHTTTKLLLTWYSLTSFTKQANIWLLLTATRWIGMINYNLKGMIHSKCTESTVTGKSNQTVISTHLTFLLDETLCAWRSIRLVLDRVFFHE